MAEDMGWVNVRIDKNSPVIQTTVEKSTTANFVGKVTVTSTSTPVLAANSNRKCAIIINDSDAVIYIAYSNTATLNEGIRLNPSGGVLIENTYTGPISAITATGSKNLTVTEI